MEVDYTYCITINWIEIGKAAAYIVVGGIVVFVVLMKGIFGD